MKKNNELITQDLANSLSTLLNSNSISSMNTTNYSFVKAKPQREIYESKKAGVTISKNGVFFGVEKSSCIIEKVDIKIVKKGGSDY